MAEGKLKEVERDAMRIQTKRFNDFFEEQNYKEQLAKESAPSATSDESDKKGK